MEDNKDKQKSNGGQSSEVVCYTAKIDDALLFVLVEEAMTRYTTQEYRKKLWNEIKNCKTDKQIGDKAWKFIRKGKKKWLMWESQIEPWGKKLREACRAV